MKDNLMLKNDTTMRERVLYSMTKDMTINRLVDMFKERQEEYKRQIDDLKSKTDIFSNIDISLFQLIQKINELNNIVLQQDTSNIALLHKKIDVIIEAFGRFPEWIPANSLQESTGLKADAIRLQLQNPAIFEPEVDFKKIGRLWYVHKNAIAKIRRQK